MFRPATRLILRSSRVGAPSSLLAPPFFTRAAPARRCISTAPPSQKSRSWKSLVARVGLAGAVIYFYNTTEVFADEPRHAVHQVPELADENDQLPTIEALAQERRQRKAELVAEKNQAAGVDAQGTAGAGDVQELEEEAGQQGAFNPETGEINWDCPCLGGMATGPCGEQFKAAFSCFVYSTEEPKGMDCVDKFKDMQNCFREYPEVYGSELEGDDDDDDDVTGDEELAALADSESAPSEKAADSRPEVVKQAQRERGRAETEQRKKEQALGGGDEVVPRDERREMERALSESDELVPKAGHDERQANEQHLQSRSK